MPLHCNLAEIRQGDAIREADDQKMKIKCLPNQGANSETYDHKPLTHDYS